MRTVLQAVVAATVSGEVLIRDYRTKTNSSMHVTGTLYDSTAGTWIGTRGEVEGLPTPQYRYDGLPIINRVPLGPKIARLGWPARMAGRLDMIYDSGKTIQFYSGMLAGPRYFLSAAHCMASPAGREDFAYCVRVGNELDGRSVTGWISNGGNNISGFHSLPGGQRYGGSKFSGAGSYGQYWTSSERNGDEELAYIFDTYKDPDTEYWESKRSAYSLRCVKDR